MSIIEFDVILDQTITIPKEAETLKGKKVHIILQTKEEIPASINSDKIALNEGYHAMALDREREAEAAEWVDALVQDNVNETR